MDQADQMRQRALDVQRIAAEARAEAVSEDGAVRAVTAAGGRVEVLDLRMNAFQMSGVELGELITETVRAAEDKMTVELTEAIQRAMGDLGTVLGEDEGR